MELGDKYINGHDVKKRYDELEGEFDDFIEHLIEWKESDDDGDELREDFNTWMSDNSEEFKQIKALKTFIENYSGDGFHCILILDEAFMEYAEEFARDCGMVGKDSSMDAYIDWNAFAEDMKMDYSSEEIDGITYWVRN